MPCSGGGTAVLKRDVDFTVDVVSRDGNHGTDWLQRRHPKLFWTFGINVAIGPKLQQMAPSPFGYFVLPREIRVFSLGILCEKFN